MTKNEIKNASNSELMCEFNITNYIIKMSYCNNGTASDEKVNYFKDLGEEMVKRGLLNKEQIAKVVY